MNTHPFFNTKPDYNEKWFIPDTGGNIIISFASFTAWRRLRYPGGRGYTLVIYSIITEGMRSAMLNRLSRVSRN